MRTKIVIHQLTAPQAPGQAPPTESQMVPYGFLLQEGMPVPNVGDMISVTYVRCGFESYRFRLE